MKNLAIALALMFTGLLTQAQEDEQQKTKVGIGASLLNYDPLIYYDWEIMPSQFSVPIDFGKFRLEPQVGLVSSIFSASLGLFKVKNRPSFKLLVGVRPGIWYVDQWDFYLSADLGAGGEFFLCEYFSLGAEVMLRYLANHYYLDEFAISTNTSLMIRFYFN